MSVASRVADGWVQKAAWYWEHGKTITQFLDAWGGYGVGENVNTLNNIWNQGIQSAVIAEIVSQPGFQGAIPVGQIPGQKVGAGSFCYGILATWADTTTGATQDLYTSYTSAYQMTNGQLHDQAGLIDPAQYTLARGGRNYGTQTSVWVLQNITIQSLTRC